MEKKLWKFNDNLGSFESTIADKIKTLYFPLGNETLLSSVSPDLHGDIKTGQDSFLLVPVSRIDLVNLRSSRNFWVYISKDMVWSATGVSKDVNRIRQDSFRLEAGLLWHRITRENKRVGLKAEFLSFVPATGEPVEIMQVKISNICAKKLQFVPVVAIPMYARGANSLRDHRHVTSLLQRLTLHRYGVIACPTLAFDESGHRPNTTNYFVLGWDQNHGCPEYIYPTQEMFCAEDGDLEAPSSLVENILPQKAAIQGREAMGALRFHSQILSPGKSCSYTIIMGITEEKNQINRIISKFNSLDKINYALARTKEYWLDKATQISLDTQDPDFDNWFRWVSVQPTLRRIFGCSFLPDFDYGKGGRGWRDLWQDCLGLILANPSQVRDVLINNFSGVRIDGSNATIIGKKKSEFISDRNNISRVWMDHGVWPLLTLELYLNETGDYGILFEEAPYFRDHQIHRSRKTDLSWSAADGFSLKTLSGKIYKGTLLEHLLIQNLVQFFNVGRHNHIRLEGADWDDGLDMAKDKGEGVAFSAMYAQNLETLADLLSKSGRRRIGICQELKILLGKVDYQDVKTKQELLNKYFESTASGLCGRLLHIDTQALELDLRRKSGWLKNHIRKSEWLREGFFNGYYDNKGRRVEGRKNSLVRMMLASQVFPVMSGVASQGQINFILRNVKKHLFDKKLKGYHLNTDFTAEQHDLGRAFSFVYGDKENGAFFNHMVVMFAYALYKRGFIEAGWQVLGSIYDMAKDTAQSKIYPCLPEYFNLEGRGMYSYLTGSASWFVLTMLTEVFGVKGEDGDLWIEPKLSIQQLRRPGTLCVRRMFASRIIEVSFSLANRRKGLGCKILKASLNSKVIPLRYNRQVRISRAAIMALPAGKINRISITLG